MEAYILKSISCLAVFYVFYKALLENASFHHIKRGYLILSILASLTIPLITFTIYVSPVILDSPSLVFNNTPIITEITEVTTPSINYIPYILWSIYSLGVLFFSIRFIKNISSIQIKISRNKRILKGRFQHILLQELIAPHTYFNSIFFNKKAYETKQIPNEVIWHEEAHAIQKHSIDLLFIELLQIVFWFNPMLYFVKKAMKLNHEFLADREVIHHQKDTASYQHILLAFSSRATPPALANSIHYSSIKKRFTVMKTHTSKKASLLKGFLILPLLAVLVYGFSTTKEVEKPLENQQENESYTFAENIDIKIKNKDFIFVNNTLTSFEDFPITLQKFNTQLTKEQRQKMIVVSITAEKDIKMGFITDLKEMLLDYGIKSFHFSANSLSTSYDSSKYITPKHPTYEDLVKWQNKQYGIWLDGKQIENKAILEYHPDDLPYYTESKLEKNAVDYGKYFIQVNIMTNPYWQDKSGIHNAIKEELERLNKLKIIYANAKTFVLMITADKIMINGKQSSLHTFVKDLNAVTKDWEEIDYTNATPSFLITATSDSFLQKVNDAFAKTHYAKANEGVRLKKGSINPPIVKKGKKSVIPPPPPPAPKTIYKFNTQATQLPPPPPPPSNKLGDVTKKYKHSIVLYVNNTNIYVHGKKTTLKEFAKTLDAHTKNWKDEDYKLYGLSIETTDVSSAFRKQINKEYRKSKLAKKSSSKNPYILSLKDNQMPPLPPPPPGPDQPLDHVIAMGLRDATFIYENKKTTSAAIIKLLKKNPNLHIKTKLQDPKPPIVYVSNPQKQAKSSNTEEVYPPYPPTPEDDLNHMIRMKLENAAFFYENNRITADEAITIFKKKKNNLRVETTRFKKSNPIVNLFDIKPSPDAFKCKTVNEVKKLKTVAQKNGCVKINGETNYYVKKGNKISYYNRWGEKINEKGEKI